jgi:hypothetical protein
VGSTGPQQAYEVKMSFRLEAEKKINHSGNLQKEKTTRMNINFIFMSYLFVLELDV